MTLGTLLGLAGAALSVLSFLMKSMLPLRTVALVANVAFFTYGLLEAQLPSILLNLVLIPLNAVRVIEMRKLVRDIEHAHLDSPLAEWLLPHMRKRRIRAGETLFNKGDIADEMYYIHTGILAIPALGISLERGALVGEIGLFTPDSQRTQTVVCTQDAELYTLNRAQADLLYYQNPRIGLQLMRLIVARLVQNRERNAPAEAVPVDSTP